MRESTLTDFLLARIADDQEWADLVGHGNEPHQQPCPGCKPRALAECEAKRALVLRFVAITAESAEFQTAELAWHEQGLFEAVHYIATAYADHPDYNEDWKP